MQHPSSVRLGLRANWRQFALLVVINAFVGAMVGLERAVLPLIAEEEFGLASQVAILSFIASFGAAKALANMTAGHLGDRWGRKQVLVLGWVLGLPVPFLIMWAPTWEWIVAANVLLGVNQGLAWSTAVIMKIDLVGPRQRGLAMGLNEAAGYIAVSVAALVSGYIAAAYALRPEPFYLGAIFALVALVLSVLFVRDTRGHARLEAEQLSSDGGSAAAHESLSFRQVFWRTSWTDRSLFAVSQAGLVNNLNDAMAWGLFPLYFAAQGFSVGTIGLLAALYPAVWGLGQLVTGALSDRMGRRGFIVIGMFLQAGAIALMLLGSSIWLMATSMVLLGAGTALVYPTLLAAIGDLAHPSWRGTSVGVYRLWRDGGYVLGALVAGFVADLFGAWWAISVVAGLTAISGIVALRCLRETLTEPFVQRTRSAPPAIQSDEFHQRSGQ